MRVLVVASLYPKTYDPVLGNFVRAQLRELQAMGVEVVGVISPVPWSPRLLWGNDRWRAFGQEPRQVTDLGNVAVLQPRVPVFPSALGLPFGRFQGPAVRKAARTLMVSAQADLIHAHSAHPDGSVAVDLGRQYGLPVVVTIHGQDLLRSIPRGRMTRRSTARTIRQADRVVLVSRRLKKIAEVEGLEGRFEVIPNGVHLDVKVDEDLARELEAMKTPRARIVLSVSNLIKTKGHEWVLRALGFGDIYWIVGDGPYRSRLEALVSSLGLRDRVRFFGAVKPTAVAAFMRAEVDRHISIRMVKINLPHRGTQAQFHIGMQFLEIPYSWNQPASEKAWSHADIHHTCIGAGKQAAGAKIYFVQGMFHGAEILFTGGSQDHPSLLPSEQRYAQISFQRLHLVADG